MTTQQQQQLSDMLDQVQNQYNPQDSYFQLNESHQNMLNSNTVLTNNQLNSIPLSSQLLKKMKMTQPKSVAESILNAGQQNIAFSVKVPPPQLILDVKTLQRAKALKPDLDYKNSEFLFQFQQEASVYVKKILKVLQIEKEDYFICPLPAPIPQLNASILNNFLGDFFQNRIKQDSQIEVGFQHTLTFANSLTKYLLDIKKPKMNSFQFNQFENQLQMIIEKSKLIELLERELKYQKLTQTYQPEQPMILAQKTIPEEQLSKTCTKLYNDHKRISQKHLQKQREKYDNELSNCTFAPDVNQSKFLIESQQLKKQDDDYYGQDKYIKQRHSELLNYEEVKINKLLNEIISEAEHFNIKLTDQFVNEVKRDLQATSSVAIQREIVQKIVEQLVKKFHELETLNYQKKLQTGERKLVKLNFKPQESIFAPITTSSDQQQDAKYKCSPTARKMQQFRDDEREKLQKLTSLNEKVERANLRAQIYKEFKSGGGNFNLDIKEVEKKYGKDGVKAILGQGSELIKEAGQGGTVTLYNCYK